MTSLRNCYFLNISEVTLFLQPYALHIKVMLVCLRYKGSF